MAAKFDVVPPSPRSVLELLPKARLLELSRELGVVVKSSATKEDQVGVLARKSPGALPAILRALGRDELNSGRLSVKTADPMQLAVVPLAVPYLLNPAGIVFLVTASAEADSFRVLAMVVILLILVLGIDVVVFRWANEAGERLVENRMLVIEMVFGFLLAALAVQLALNGLADVGVITLNGH